MIVIDKKNIYFNNAPVHKCSFIQPNDSYLLIKNLPTMRQKIKGTEYIITSRISPDAKETAVEKMRRIILNAKVEN